MLAGEAVVAIWNGITPEGRAGFYDWHLHEHIPERVAIPGFRRGRRYVATTPQTQPEFFTLYEARSMQVLEGADYAARLNAPTDATRAATVHFRDTSRSLARVLASAGPGIGGMLLTVRFAMDAAAGATIAELVRATAAMPRVTGAHLCAGDAAASGQGSRESAGRSDIGRPPDAFAMVEATDEGALAELLTEAGLVAAGARSVQRGFYRLEHVCEGDARP